MPILTAIDGEEGSERVVSEGAALASRLDEDLVVLHAAQGLRPEEARQNVDAIVAEALGDPDEATLRITDGHPAERILDAIDELDPDYVVLGSSKMTPVGKIVLGSVPQLVMRESDVPVVSVPQEAI